ncbi:MAG: FtsQ-type POTRA domain-containing protein [Chloroflexi bacterium]|uniref:FtsQ-type POTRA domain-containing protein n=1 Tax=Candidatus Chlorohelix allophototropha TaxID=3003348 RepID=A0A8T7LR48_9CHLR|nr:FtsQ-type POTRA domain-containing protein [Chloroflexota bacterium]WJW66361.1 FtsQ-type POTRA domain-containing protein [Chloroflexota bacterium L227-S17]
MSSRGPRYRSRVPRSSNEEPSYTSSRYTRPQVRIERPEFEKVKPTRKKKKKPERVKLTSTVLSGVRGSRRFSDTLKADFKSGRIPLLVGLVLALGLVYWILTASNFKMTNIKVTGSKYLDAKAVIDTTGANQQNYFLLKEDDIAAKLRQKPYILDVKVTKALPNELRIEVIERKTGAVWKIGDMYYMVDPDGVILESSAQPRSDASTLPVINSLDTTQKKVGEKVEGVAVSSAAPILDRLQTEGIKITSLDYSPTTGLIVVGNGKTGTWKALFGTDAELDKKINLLKALQARTDLKWSLADLRFTDKPVIS